MRSLDQLRSSPGSISGSTKNFQMSSRPTSDSISIGSFANLKLTAEKLVKEQASVKTDLEMATLKLKKSTEHVHALEEKLQNAINENAKLKVKQKEDVKLWKGLESKFSSTKALCDQLTETLQQLAGQVRDAEQDKKIFEDKLNASSSAFDSLQLHFSGISVKLESAEENMKIHEQKLLELKSEKEEKEKTFMDEYNRTCKLIEEKDSLIKHLEEAVSAEKVHLESLTSRLEEVQHDLRVKEDICQHMRVTQENLEKENHSLESINNEYANSLLQSGQELKGLENSLHRLVEKSVELDNHSLVITNHVIQLNTAFDTCYKLVQKEKDLILKRAQCQFDQLHNRFLHVTTENTEFRSEKEELNKKVIELQKDQEVLMVQHAEECHITEDKIRGLESELQTLVLKKADLELQVAKLEESIEHLSETSSVSETEKQDLMLRISTLESEKQEIQDQLQVTIQGKSEEIEVLQKEIVRHEELVDSLEKQASQLRDTLEEKEQLHLQFIDKEKHLEDQRTETLASLAVAENTLTEAKKQYDLMLESKQMELSKHLKEISQRNDQAINDIRRKFELEKLVIINLEKEKADKLVREMETTSEQKVAESKEESRQYLIHVQEEHASLILSIHQEHDKKVSDIRADHSEELRHARLEAEDELREKTMLLRKELEGQIRALRHQHDEECQRLQEELELQKTKEERQRALLQLQWKVMGGNPQEDQEVNSKKEHSISSTKMRGSDGKKRSQPTLTRANNEEKTSPCLRATQTPVSDILKKVEKVDTGGVMSVPKHSRKVTHREYEVETSNGKITKRRKTKSTVMFADPTKHKRMMTPRTRASKDTAKVTRGDGHSRPSNIGDLFSEGSLNPYTDDPYAFD
ncbi:Synaptonemal complex protein [Thalictrum thalictroides]|uniref:Synaptonemal complex protein n=1 Tax=Thalictrum thalictroides TaxID=46969 RepID=A0A7J6WFR7_THATH|nr:Synaptonemal complex protein [Thalictrum thalictroides]